jgi:hypothetical protein
VPFIKLNFKPGLNRDQTNYSNEGGWFECDKIRFLSGYPQKIGGWIKATPNFMLGVGRQMYNWLTTYSDNLLGIGTDKKLYIEVGGIFYDITPLKDTSVNTTTFTATTGSSTLVVVDSGSDTNTGDFVTFSGATTLGGNITAAVLNQNYEVTTINANAYSITAKSSTTGLPVLANSSDSGNGGGAVTSKYEIAIGNAGNTLGYGWGTGVYSAPGIGWGLASATPVNLPQRDWWFDNFDNDAVANIRDGEIYYWERGTAPIDNALADRAVLLSGLTLNGVAPSSVPNKAMQILVSQNDKHLLAFGTQPFGGAPTDFDPLLIRWATQDQPNVWNPLPTNTAGFIRISRGSQIVRALPTRQEILVFTDSHLYSFQYTGTTDVFSLQELADNISIISPRACASANNVTYWMGQDKFYAYSGRVETLPCTLRTFLFQDVDYNQADKIVSGTNEGFNEVWWFYPSVNSNVNNRYIIYNYLEKIWYYGNIERTAWLDSPSREFPQAIQYDSTTEIGYLLDHENGINDDTLPMEAYIQSSDFDLDDGEKFILTRRMIPDVNFTASTSATPTVNFAMRPRNFPGSSFEVDPFDSQSVVESSIGVYTDQVFIRARARQMAIKVSSNALGVQWQLGSPRLDGRADGKR